MIILMYKVENNKNSIIYGNQQAPIKIIEYSNFECIDCYYLHKNIEMYLKYYIDNNIIQYEIKHVKIDSFYRGKYIYENMKNLDNIENLFRVYKTYPQWKKINKDKIHNIFKLNKIKFFKRKELSKNDEEIIKNNIVCVPTLYINEKKYMGIISGDEFKNIIEFELKQ